MNGLPDDPHDRSRAPDRVETADDRTLHPRGDDDSETWPLYSTSRCGLDGEPMEGESDGLAAWYERALLDGRHPDSPEIRTATEKMAQRVQLDQELRDSLHRELRERTADRGPMRLCTEVRVHPTEPGRLRVLYRLEELQEDRWVVVCEWWYDPPQG